ncbi:MAG: thioredoxin-disulfide reductase [Candidatus Roizmanbacteria bacterium]|nr:thioredoxin-disulfide reductase [Candidatus Roizmanbacteria bacterium]
MENVIIIGGGPAGLSAAIYLARANLNPLVFAGSPPGGQLTLTSEVENYPGFESILGSELIEKMRNQAKKFGTKIVDENVINVDFSKASEKTSAVFPLRSPTAEVKARSVIIATGAKALWLNLPSETRLRGKGVSACATCDGFFFREKTVAVVGGGDTALEEALTLTKFAKKVYIIHRRDFFRASKIMQERVLKNEKIEIIWNSTVEKILGEKRVEGAKIKLQISNNKSQINIKYQILKLDGIFIAIGHKPDTDLFKNKVEMDEKGYVITSTRKALDNSKFLINLISNKAPKTNDQTNKLDFSNFLGQLDQLGIRNFNLDYQSATSVPGVFVAGDCADPYYRQAITAAGTGVEAALDVERYLESN